MSESAMQAALFEFYAVASGRIPELEYAFHVPNGELRTISTARRLKQMGVKRGVPDVLLPIPRTGFHGLAIELKYGKNKVTADQARWIDMLRMNSWCVVVAYDWQSAAFETVAYLGHDPHTFGLSAPEILGYV